MPTYDYRCTACDERFEISRPMGSSVDEVCPKCASPAKRVFTPVGVAFKGTGFHNTDYKTRPSESPAPAPAACASKSDGCKGCPAAD